MRRFWFNPISLISLFVLLAWCASVDAAGPRKPLARPGELIVKYRSPVEIPSADEGAMMPNGAEQEGKQTIRPGTAYSFRPASEAATPAARPETLRSLDGKHHLRAAKPLFEPPRPTRGKGPFTGPVPSIQSATPAVLPAESSLWVLRFDPSIDIEAVRVEYAADPNVIYAEPNWQGSLCYAPADPLYAQTSADLSLIGIEQAWEVQEGADASVVVAVIDSGVERYHPDLAPALDLANSWNFVDGNANVFDDLGHGTRVAGIIGAAAGNAEGIAGVAFGCSILSLDVTDPSGVITTADVASAVNWAVAHGAHVVNMSLRFSGQSQALETACQAASDAGVLLVAAAGNENQGDLPVYPASYDYVIGVGALADDGQTRASFSNYDGLDDSLVELVAPGDTVFSTIPGSQYNGTYGSGTSFAAPMVSGVAALLKAKYPDQTGPAIRDHLHRAAQKSATFSPYDGQGYGVLRAQAALETAMVPQVEVQSVRVDDDPSYDADNDDDGALDRGETARIVVTLSSGKAAVRNVTATLATTSADIGSIADPTATWSVIEHAKPSDNATDPFVSIVVNDTAGVQDVPFSLALVGDDGFSDTLAFDLPVEDEVTLSGAKKTDFTADRTYHVTGNLVIYGDVTIEPGTLVKVDPGVDIQVGLPGFTTNLTAVGTPESPIRFTSTLPYGSRMGEAGAIGPRTEAVDLGAYQQVRYISAATGSDKTGDGSRARPWASVDRSVDKIQDASGTNRYAVLVAEGVYRGASPGSAITLHGYIDLFGGFEDRGWTRDIVRHVAILDGANQARAIMSVGGGRVDGFLMTRGDAKGQVGGAVYCYENSSLQITNNTIIDNQAGTGGAIFCTFLSWPVISSNRIIGNYASNRGVAIDCDNSGTGEISNNIIVDNSAGHHGGGIYFFPASALALRNNTIVGNSAPEGGGIECSSGYLSLLPIVNNIICGNSGGNVFADLISVLVSCDIEGGWSGAGTGNIDADPQFDGGVAWGVVSAIEYQSKGCRSILTDSEGSLEPDSLMGGILYLNDVPYVVMSNTADTLVVVGDATRNGTVSAPQSWEVFEYRLKPTSPCIGAGVGPDDPTYGAGLPVQDIEGNVRAGLGCDMGADEYSFSAAPGRAWGRLWVTAHTTDARFENLIVENGTGLLNECDATFFSNCLLQRNTGYGLWSTAGAEISGTTATLNAGPGLDAPDCDLESCFASHNNGKGIIGGSLTSCTARGNGSEGLTATTATDCTSILNGGTGAVLFGSALRVMARENSGKGIVTSSGNVTDSVALRNGGVGIEISGGGTIDGCAASSNGEGGIVTAGSSVTGCIVEDNTGVGVTGSGASVVSDTRIIGNSGTAVIGVQTVTNCAVVRNAPGIEGAATITGTYAAFNTGRGISGGGVESSTIVGNTDDGVRAPDSLRDSWIIGNGGFGVFSTGRTVAASDCSILHNAGIGTQDLLSLNNSNVYGNDWLSGNGIQIKDTVATSGRVDFESNWWDLVNVSEITGKTYPSDLSFAQDFFDNSGSGFFDVWPPASAFMDNAPSNLTPAFLRSVEPNLDSAVNVGFARFTLTFSETMDTNPSSSIIAVTFGLAAPYESHVVQPDPGWLAAGRTWQGRFAVQGDTGDGVNTIKVSSARAADGFVVPDDTAHLFEIDTSGGLAANNGGVLPAGSGFLSVGWSEVGSPVGVLGYNIRRSASGIPGTFQRINPATVHGTSYLDAGLIDQKTYYYIVDLVDFGNNAVQWTPVFSGRTSNVVSIAAPTGVSASDGVYTDKVQVSWSSVLGANYYEVYRNTSDSVNAAARLLVTAGTTADDATVTSETPYYYWVRAGLEVSGTAYLSSFSLSDSGYARAVPIPDPPESINYPAGDNRGSYTVSWTASSAATSYELERSSDDGAIWVQICSGPDTSYAENIADGIYLYRVKATNSAGSSAWFTGTHNCVVAVRAEKWADGYGWNSAYRTTKHIRTLGDVNGDGKDDIVAFGDNGVQVAMSSGSSFAHQGYWDVRMTYSMGWRVARHPRAVADMNDDGMDDIVGFGDRGVFIGFSTGAGFSSPEKRINGFAYSDGWQVRDEETSGTYDLDEIWSGSEQFCLAQEYPGQYVEHPRMVVDIDGDGALDIAGFGPNGVTVALNRGDGTFGDGSVWFAGWNEDDGWKASEHVRTFADLNGDGFLDIVGIGQRKVAICLCEDTDGDGLGDAYLTPQGWKGDFSADMAWRIALHPRMTASVNGDSYADLVCFGDRGVLISICDGTEFLEPEQRLKRHFCRNEGWATPEECPRWVLDMDGDGDDDILGIGTDGVYVSLGVDATGDGHADSFTAPEKWANAFGSNSTPACDPDRHLRLVGDVDGDGIPEIVGFFDDGVYVY
ncbi:S8 family serine peptidase [bacterium]|nr:S8 family serine peptidase [bacterium]